MKFFEDEDKWPSLWNWIKYKYWDIIPYDYRPFQIVYRLKCFLFKRYTVVKPRTLKFFTWVDRSELLPHYMFEILSQFIEKECGPDGHREWYGEYGHKITVSGIEKFVRDEMQDLYDWWHKTYNKEYEEVNNILWKEIRKHSPLFLFKELKERKGYQIYEPKFKNQDDEEIYKRNMKAASKLEQIQEKDLQGKMHRLVNIVHFMWT